MEEQENKDEQPLYLIMSLDPLYDLNISDAQLELILNRCNNLTYTQCFLYLKRVLSPWDFNYFCLSCYNNYGNSLLLRDLGLEHLLDKRIMGKDDREL